MDAKRNTALELTTVIYYEEALQNAETHYQDTVDRLDYYKALYHGKCGELEFHTRQYERLEGQVAHLERLIGSYQELLYGTADFPGLLF